MLWNQMCMSEKTVGAENDSHDHWVVHLRESLGELNMISTFSGDLTGTSEYCPTSQDILETLVTMEIVTS